MFPGVLLGQGLHSLWDRQVRGFFGQGSGSRQGSAISFRSSIRLDEIQPPVSALPRGGCAAEGGSRLCWQVMGNIPVEAIHPDSPRCRGWMRPPDPHPSLGVSKPPPLATRPPTAPWVRPLVYPGAGSGHGLGDGMGGGSPWRRCQRGAGEGGLCQMWGQGSPREDACAGRERCLCREFLGSFHHAQLPSPPLRPSLDK